MIELADSHCHIDFPDYESSHGELIGNARELGVRYLLNISVCLEDFPRVLAVAQSDPEVFATVGVHPNYDSVEEPTADRLVELAGSEKVVGIGETGLDYFRHHVEPADQLARFRAHIEAARRLDLPLIIHSRQAREDTVAMLREAADQGVAGVMHCFAEDWETARAALDAGFYISFSGIVTFKNAPELREVARKVPEDRMLVETDAPYLAPEPYRGKTNQPGYVRYTAERVAEERGETLEALAEATTENFLRLFRISRNG
ncbi:TatD family hydrolase [Thiohalorhabdus sp. Cl-TMA]|uniref:TatD family hydrolase n=1 Tax=Thiohalorhabdus methylotrophus TaxID=3242694 RepID=A0ABV4TXM7_9GAMM